MAGITDMQYRRAQIEGGTYFFTVVTFNRRKVLGETENIELLRLVVEKVKIDHPFTIDAMVVMPDHIHSVWTLPSGDRDFPMRWNLIKREFSRQCPDWYKAPLTLSRQKKGEQAVWQRRYWEHQIRDDKDFNQHVDYIHYNPVKHGYVKVPGDWPFSSFHRFVEKGIYPQEWGSLEVTFDKGVGGE
jgi:putative transposase